MTITHLKRAAVALSLIAIVLGVALVTLALPAAASTADQCAAYTYTGTQRSLCADFPGSRDRDCADIGYRVTLKSTSYDPWRLSTDRDGTGCDTKPLKPVPTPSATVSPSATASPSVTATGSPSPSATLSPSPSVSASVSPSASMTTSPSASASPSAIVIERDSEELPLTGPPVPVIALAAVGLLFAGAAAVLAARRRRRFIA